MSGITGITRAGHGKLIPILPEKIDLDVEYRIELKFERQADGSAPPAKDIRSSVSLKAWFDACYLPEGVYQLQTERATWRMKSALAHGNCSKTACKISWARSCGLSHRPKVDGLNRISACRIASHIKVMSCSPSPMALPLKPAYDLSPPARGGGFSTSQRSLPFSPDCSPAGRRAWWCSAPGGRAARCTSSNEAPFSSAVVTNMARHRVR